MQKHLRITWVIIAILAAHFAPPSAFVPIVRAQTPPPASQVPAPPADPIRIGIGRSQLSASITSVSGLSVIAGGVVKLQVPGGQTVKVDGLLGQLQVSGLAGTLPGPVRLVPNQAVQPLPLVGAKPDNPVSYGGKPYRGEIEVLISPNDGKLSVVNVINTEDYIYGVVPKEMQASWPMEALKAQAVAARTFAKRNLGRYAAEGFDLVDTPMSQAYGGLASEQPRTTEAVIATRSQVLTYQGALASTFYHASSGGHTENSNIIWNGPYIAYLRGVPDFDAVPQNPHFGWERTFTLEEAASTLVTNKFGVGVLKAIQPSGTMGASGRPSHWTISGSTQTVKLTAEQLRWTFGLRSSARSILVKLGGYVHPTHAVGRADLVHVVGAGGTAIRRTVNGSSVVGAGANAVPIAAPAVTLVGGLAWQEPGIRMTGGGWGHGVGMSQWGAYGMSVQGKTYTEILTHYYQGTKVETR
jgi:stage II sporulation protein D